MRQRRGILKHLRVRDARRHVTYVSQCDRTSQASYNRGEEANCRQGSLVVTPCASECYARAAVDVTLNESLRKKRW